MRMPIARLIDWQIAEGTTGLVPVGTTGESPTLSHEEHKRVVELAVAGAKGRVPVMAGAGSNSTAEAIGLAQHARRPGRMACWSSPRTTTSRPRKGCTAITRRSPRRSSIPLVIYNIPGRSVIDMSRGDDGASRRDQEHRGREGRDREPDPPAAHAPRLRAGFHPALGRGPHRGRLSGQPAGMAASPSPPTWRPGSAPRCMRPGPAAT